MHALHARRHGGSWRIRIAPVAVEGQERAPGAEVAVDAGRRALLAWRDRLVADGCGEAVCAEFPKAVIGEGEAALGYAQLIADRCADGAEDAFGIVAPRAWLSRRSVAMALRARGLRAPRFSQSPLLDGFSMLLAGIAAWGMLLLHAIVHAPVARRAPAGAWWLAVHGEWSNRTRHVLPEASGDRPPAAILLLGRPRSAIPAIRAEWRSRIGATALPVLVRPWSLASVLCSLPPAAGVVIESMRIAARAPYLPAFRDRIGMLYRMQLGLASARWWRRQRQRPPRVVYGHAGNADTTLLELAQQATGQQTWHIVHGVSAGLNFTGRSSVAVFTCAHDARWHERLQGYGRCLHLPVPLPAPVSGASGLLLLTNYAHPMNMECRLSGTRAEEAVLHAVSDAAARLGEGTLHWRPHPALAALDRTDQEALRWVAGRLGYRELPAGCDWLQAAREARWVVTTASTVAIQLLEAGVVPIVLIPGWLDPDCALARHPLAVRDMAELPDAMARLQGDGPARARQLEDAWQAIGPGRLANATDWME